MKQFFKMFFASLLALIVGGVVLVGITIAMVIGAVKTAKTTKAEESADVSSILLIETNKRLHEQGEKNSFPAFGGGQSYATGLYEAVAALRKAKDDNSIKGVLLKLEGGANGWAAMQTLREALVDFRKSGKKVYAYGESISQRDYFLASAADVIYLNPAGMMELKGLATQLAFFKGTLDKLGVKPEIFYAGRFKSATEPFRAEKMSEPNKQQIAALQTDIWSSFLSAANQKSGLDSAAINRIAANGGVFFASEAAANHLIDGAKYWDELEDLMRPVVSKKADQKMPYLSIDEYAGRLDDDTKGEGRIAVLFAEGEIVDGEGSDYQIASETLVKSIRQIRRNDKVKAVVLRVNSPGGSALASEVILRELKLLQVKKPLIVSMGDVAASGGYYISSGADSIFAMPNTITGSIGVFGMLFDFSTGLKDKLGVTFDEVKNQPLADFPTASRPLTMQESARMQMTIDTIYSTFKNHVVQGRRLDPVMVDSIAQGRVWTGSDALRIGLVDGLGGLDRALKSAAARAKLNSYSITTYPDPVDQFQSMLKRFKSGPFGAASAEEAISKELREHFAIYMQLKWLQRICGKAQMMMPFVPEFH